MSSHVERLADRLSPSAIKALLSAQPNGLVLEIRDGDPVSLGELEAEHHVVERLGQWIVSRSGHRVLELLKMRGLSAEQIEQQGLEV